MLQVVRRPPTPLGHGVKPASRKEKQLEIAFVSLVATNLFVVSSALAFYLLVNRG